jgi:hypothetical protein
MPAGPPRRAQLTAGLVLAATVLAAPTAAAAPPKPDLRPGAVRSAGVAHAGGALPVTLRVTATGRTRQTQAVVLLSKDRRRSKDDVKLPGSARIAANRRRGASRMTITVNAQVPEATVPGNLVALVCVDDPGRVRERSESNNCAAAARPVAITAEPDPARTSAALIAADLAARKLSPEKALTYRVFALFGDSRLPAKYQGDAGEGAGHLVMREVANAWRGLSKSARRALSRYMLPPPAAGSWYRRLGQQAGAAQYQQTPDECVSESFRREWNTRSAGGGKVKLHWPKDRPQAAAMAKDLAWAAHLAYGHHKRAMGREPISDAKSSCFHGPDGALDIYLLENIPYAEGYTVPADKTTRTSPQCDGMASFIVMDEGHPKASFSRRFTLAHELFHAFQNAFAYQAGCEPYSWFDEGSANWAAHATFPDDQSEHFFEWGIESPQHTMLYRDYQNWPFMLWMEKAKGEGSIGATYRGFEKARSLIAVDRAIGLRGSYLDFAKSAWNQKPLEPAFVAWDKFPVVPKRKFEPIPDQHLLLAGQKTRTANVPFALEETARDYAPFTITDEKVKEVVFRNPLAANPDARIGAILTFKSGATRFDDWSGKETVRFCRDNPGEDVISIVMVYANSSTNEDSYIDATPTLNLKDECPGFPWHFKVKAAALETLTNASRTGGSSDHICGVIAGMPISGQQTFKVAGSDLPFSGEQAVKLGFGGALEGSVFVEAPGTWHWDLHGCRLLPDPPEVCDSTLDRTPMPDGNWTVGFSLRASSATAESATLSWAVPDPDPGFFDADDSVCNVFSIWKGLESGREDQQVPLKTLAGTEPFTLSFDGDGQWTADQLGKPASIAYSWKYSMTLQRVDAQGNPL